MAKVLMYGAAFNPITFAHLLTAEIVRNRRGFDKVLFTPSSTKRRDKSDKLIGDEHRLEMLKLSVADNAHFEVCDLELTNPIWESKTEYTLRHYKELNPEDDVYFLIGADNLAGLPDWDNGEELVRDNKFIVMARDNFDMVEIIAKNKILRKYESNFDLLHKGIRMDISSTMVRDNTEIGLSTKYLLPEACIAYIEANGLYGFVKEVTV